MVVALKESHVSPKLFVDRSPVFTFAVNVSKHIEELLRLYNPTVPQGRLLNSLSSVFFIHCGTAECDETPFYGI